MDNDDDDGMHFITCLDLLIVLFYVASFFFWLVETHLISFLQELLINYFA